MDRSCGIEPAADLRREPPVHEASQHRTILDAAILKMAFAETGAVVAVIDGTGAVLESTAGAHAERDPTQARGGWITFWIRNGLSQAQDALTAARSGRRSLIRCREPAEDGRLIAWDCALFPCSTLGPDRFLVVARDVTDAQETSWALSKTARLYQALIEATSEIVWHYDTASGITSRPGWFEFTGHSDNAADFDDWLNDLHPDDRAAAKHATDDAVDGHESLTVRYRLRHKSGEWRWMEDHAVPLTNAEGEITDWIGIVSDIHDQTLAQDALRKSEERLRLAIEATGLGTWDWDIATGERQWSDEARAALGLPAGSSPSPQVVLEQICEEDRSAAERLFDPASRAGTNTITVRLRPSPGKDDRWVEMRCRTYIGANQEPVRQVGTMQDVTDRRQAEHRIWSAAYTDELTGIPNRSLFHHRLDEAVAEQRRRGAHIGLAVIDLDDFKEVNDSLGHDAGDEVLKTVAKRLSERVPAGATVARLGGDEFAVIFPQIDEATSLAAIANDLAAALAPPLRYRSRELSCQGSVGFTTLPRLRGDAATALQHADIAMYAAKAAGGGRALAYHPSMGAKLDHRLKVLRETRVALNRDAVMPFYQPKICLETGRIVGFEALLRWSDGASLRSPEHLAEALSDPQLAVMLGRRMLQRVTADMRAWGHAGYSFGHVGLNVAAPEFAGGTFAHGVLEALKAAELRPSQLEIEVTESVFLGEGSAAVAAAIKQLHDAGVAVALDDFGTGFASLTHLLKFPVTCLKIDRSFVAQIEGESGSAVIVEAVIELAHRLGMQVVAEGIETLAQLDILRRNHCDVGQGFLFAKPMAASRVPHFLANWKPFGGQLAESSKVQFRRA